MINKIILFLIYLGLLLLLSCKTKVSKPEAFVPDTLKTIGLFNKHSFWVYINDSSGKADCTYVKDTPIPGQRVDGDAIYHYLEIPLESSIFHSFYLEGGYSDRYGYPFKADLKHSSTCCIAKTAFIIYADTFPHTGNQYCYVDYYCSREEFEKSGSFSNFTINNQNFHNTVLTKSNYTFYVFGKDSIKFYFTPKIGIVKMIITTDSSYSQKRITKSYSLVKFKIY